MAPLPPGVRVDGGDVSLTSRAAIERLCFAFASMNDAHLPIARAAADGVIGLVMVANPHARLTARSLKCASRPVLVLLGDDPHPTGHALGPDAWPCVETLRRWCRAVIVHGGAGHAEHYRLAVQSALIHQRTVMVETDSAHAQTWAERFDCRHTLVMLPSTGIHPAPIAPEMVQ